MNNKLEPLSDPFPKQVAQIMQHYPRVEGYLLTLFRVFANSARFAEKCVPNLLDDKSPLRLRHRELVILRVTALRGCEYEWGVHVSLFGKAAGLTPRDITDLCADTPDPGNWTERELNLLAVADQLCSCGSLSAETQTAFQTHWSVEQQLEILALCGTYSTVSFVANLAGLAPEPFAARFPSA